MHARNSFENKIKLLHKCNINTQNEHEHHLCNLPELIKNQAQIQVFESTTQDFTKMFRVNTQ